MQLEILKNTVRLHGIPAEIQAVADGTPAAAEITRSSKRRNKTFCGMLEIACGGEDDLIAATADARASPSPTTTPACCAATPPPPHAAVCRFPANCPTLPTRHPAAAFASTSLSRPSESTASAQPKPVFPFVASPKLRFNFVEAALFRRPQHQKSPKPRHARHPPRPR